MGRCVGVRDDPDYKGVSCHRRHESCKRLRRGDLRIARSASRCQPSPVSFLRTPSGRLTRPGIQGDRGGASCNPWHRSNDSFNPRDGATNNSEPVTPVKTGVQKAPVDWIPASAGMTAYVDNLCGMRVRSSPGRSLLTLTRTCGLRRGQGRPRLQGCLLPPAARRMKTRVQIINPVGAARCGRPGVDPRSPEVRLRRTLATAPTAFAGMTRTTFPG